MVTPGSYFIPARSKWIEQEIKRSRFIATIGHVRGREQAQQFIIKAQEQWPGATHYCSAFVAGDPATTMDIGMSDGGEPQGTAGRPILNVLRHSGIGEVAAVVIRYFGGIRLGTGGLVRAYAGSVQKVLEELPLDKFIPSKRVRFVLPYADEDALRRLLNIQGFALEDICYTHEVEIYACLPCSDVPAFYKEVCDRFRGRVRLMNGSQSAPSADKPE
jgi:uncharacterized YigZ family protein